jgi:NCS1 family nucleobase:cation symporter-1
MAAQGTLYKPDFVELEEDVSDSPLWNKDLAPVPILKRNWTTYNYAALWISMAHCIPTYMLASSLIDLGMNWWQALMTILLGNTIVLAPILLNSHPGTKYGIPFPVFARASYGTKGSNLPAIMRALVACGWFGIQAWIGGEAVHTLIRVIWPGWQTLLGDKIQGPALIAGHTPTEYVSFLLFWALNVYIIYRGMDLLRKVENWAAPFVLIMAAALMVWVLWRAKGLGTIMQSDNKFGSFGAFWKVFIPSLTGMIGYWSTLSLNMPDFTRFSRSQRDQTIGQTVALPATMVVFAAMGVVITSASTVIFGRTIWDPVQLVGQFTQPLVVAISMFTIVVATLSVNIAANVVSPANDFANAFPRRITFRLGGLITGILGILMLPWRWLADPSGYVFQWLVGYSGGLGSIAGVLIVDYWLIRRKHLELPDLYRVRGVYSYARGWNWRAVVATFAGCVMAWGGWSDTAGEALIPALKPLYAYGWFVGLFVSAVVYTALMKGVPVGGAAQTLESVGDSGGD